MEASATTAKAVIARSLEEAAVAARVAADLRRPLTLLADRSLGATAGPAWLVALASLAVEAAPEVEMTTALDAGGAAGRAQAALTAGVDAIVFEGPAEIAARLENIARTKGRSLLREPPPALDIQAAEGDKMTACRRWLAE